MRTSQRTIRSLATAAVAGLLALTGVEAMAANPNAAPHDRTIAGLSVQMAGEMPATASAEMAYGVMVEAISTLSPVNHASVTVSVTDAPFTDVAKLSAFVDSPTDTAVHRVAAAPIADGTAMGGQLRTGARTNTTVIVPPGGLGLDVGAPGVYGVVVKLVADGETLWTRVAPVTWQPAALPSLAITPVVSITGAQSRVDALLAAAADPRISLLVDPTALTSNQRLSLANREAYALPAADIDITSAAHAQTPGLIDAAVTRSRASSALPWIAVAAAADASTVSAATTAGATAVLIDSRWDSISAPEGGGAYDAGEVDGVATAPVIVADRALSTMLATRSPADSTSTAWVVAQAAFEARAGLGSIVLAPGDAWGVEGSGPSRALTVLLNAPFVTATTLESLITSPAREPITLHAETLLPSDASAENAVSAVNELSSLSVLATATSGPSEMIAAAERGVLESLSLANRADPAYRDQQIAAAAEQSDAVLAAVAITSGSQLLLVSSSGSMPITVSNDLDVPVTVRLAVTSQSPILRTTDQPEITIDAGADTTVKVPVTAISSGDVKVSVALRTDEGATIAVAETLQVRVRAAWGNLATGLFTVGLVVLLIAGLVRTVRRGRKDTRLLPTPDTDVAGPSDGDA